MVTRAEGYNLAAIMLLGKDDVILKVTLAYVTDVCQIIVPLNDSQSYDFGRIGNETNATNRETNGNKDDVKMNL